MTFFGTLLGFIWYFTLYLYYQKPWTLILTLLLLIFSYILYRTNTKNGQSATKIFISIQNFIILQTKKYRINSYLSQYNKKSKRPRLLITFIPIILILIIGYLIYTQVIFFAIVTSDSMVPTFKTNDLILMQSFSIEPEAGDIIMFNTKEALLPVTHRIISINSNGIKTKGDARHTVDEWSIVKDQIHSEVITYKDKPVIIKDVGSYFLFDPKKAVTYTSFGGEEFYKFSEFLKVFKKFGLVIFILCIITYLVLAARDFIT